MAQISCSFKLLNRYWKQGCPVFLLMELPERDFSWVILVLVAGARWVLGVSRIVDAHRSRCLGIPEVGKSIVGQKSNLEQFLANNTAQVMRRGLKLPFGFFFIIISHLISPLPEVFFFQSQALFPRNPWPSPTGWGHRFGSNQTRVGNFYFSLMFPENILVLFWGKKALDEIPAKLLSSSA